MKERALHLSKSLREFVPCHSFQKSWSSFSNEGRRYLIFMNHMMTRFFVLPLSDVLLYESIYQYDE